jgi:predicted lipid-binding transport protein (Tim44 family)
MRNILIAALAALFTGVFVAEDAEARRLGGARSLGVQRNVTPPPPRPAQQQAAPAGQQQAAPAAAGAQGAAPAATGSRWMPVIGGLALGGMLGWLFAGNGLGGILLLALLAIGAVMLFRAFARRAAPTDARMQYAGGGGQRVSVPTSMPSSGGEGQAAVGSPTRISLPKGFDADGFLRAAKTNFVKLQLANDVGDLDEIRDFTTPEMFQALSADILARAEERQETDVAGLEAQLLEIKSEGDRHWASVAFSGLVREAAGEQAQPFSEVWHLAKPMDGSSGWLLAGIQQPH